MRTIRLVRSFLLFVVFAAGILSIIASNPPHGGPASDEKKAANVTIYVLECEPNNLHISRTVTYSGRLQHATATTGSVTTFDKQINYDDQLPDNGTPCSGPNNEWGFKVWNYFSDLRPGTWTLTASIGDWQATCQVDLGPEGKNANFWRPRSGCGTGANWPTE